MNKLSPTSPQSPSRSSSSGWMYEPSRVLESVRAMMRGRAAAPRLIQLDILRGIAILLVLGRHPVMRPHEAGVLRHVAATWERFGWTGVDLFFVLSGFLIGGLLFAELHGRGRLDVRRFLIRRGFKIWPSYYVYLAILAAFGSVSIPALLNIQNYCRPELRPHLWSLAVEEHFYLALPLLLVVIGGRRLVPVALAVVMVACTLLRCRVVAHQPYDPLTHLEPTHLRIDSLAFGVLLAYVREYCPEIWEWMGRRRLRLLIFGLFLIAPMIALAPERYAFVPSIGLTSLYIGFGAILVAVMNTPGGRMDNALGRIIALIGFYSYPVYLWHLDAAYPLATLLSRQLAIPGPLRWMIAMSAYIVFATVAAIIMSRVVERPALALRDRLFPSRTR